MAFRKFQHGVWMFVSLFVSTPTNKLFFAPTAKPSDLGPEDLARVCLGDIQVDLESHFIGQW